MNNNKTKIDGLFYKFLSNMALSSLVKLHKLRNKNPLAIDVK